MAIITSTLSHQTISRETRISETGENDSKPEEDVDIFFKMIDFATEMFSEKLYEQHAKENLPAMQERFVTILKENLNEADSMNKINDIAYLVFTKYLDVETEEFLPKIHQVFPDFNFTLNIDLYLKKRLRIQAHMFHRLNIRSSMIKAIQTVFSHKSFDEINIDLSRRV